MPNINDSDTIVLEYNSDKAILYFSKENDNGLLDAYIKNLPKDLTFYWFVGPMHLLLQGPHSVIVIWLFWL